MTSAVRLCQDSLCTCLQLQLGKQQSRREDSLQSGRQHAATSRHAPPAAGPGACIGAP